MNSKIILFLEENASKNKHNKKEVFTLSAKKSSLQVKKEWCKGCNICVAFCPKNVLALDQDNKIEIVDIDSCISCGLCELRCPDFAIFLGGTE